MIFIFVYKFYRLGGNNIGNELERRCYTECEFNRSLPALRASFCVPLVAVVHSSRTTAFVAECILVMLGSNGRKLIRDDFVSSLAGRREGYKD